MSKPMLDFRSDNVGSVHPGILAAVGTANSGTEASYGAGAWSERLDARFSELFGTSVKVFPVSTGTAANALGLACCARPYGGIYCHTDAHIETSEGAATEVYTGGAKLIPLAGSGFRLAPEELGSVLAAAERGARHKPQPDAISVTQATEAGTVYQLEELNQIGVLARQHRLRFHMDGARLANALATLACPPADVTWRAGVDILSFGATKNGGMSTEAIVVFTPELAEDLSYRLRRAGQTWSKMRFAAAQLLAYVEDDLYLSCARQANALASRLADGIAHLPGTSLVAPVEANIVHLRLPDAAITRLTSSGALFFRRAHDRIRLVCRFDTRSDDVDRFIEMVGRETAGQPARPQVA